MSNELIMSLPVLGYQSMLPNIYYKIVGYRVYVVNTKHCSFVSWDIVSVYKDITVTWSGSGKGLQKVTDISLVSLAESLVCGYTRECNVFDLLANVKSRYE